jgi:Na+/H+-dicarboxylate symporter
MAACGFGLVVVLSVFPWSRFGAASGPFEAWTTHWSLLAVAAGAAGLVASLVLRHGPLGQAMGGAVYLGLAALVFVGAYLHHLHPPPLSSASLAPLGAMVGAAAAAGGAVMKLLRARPAPPS